ncbi:MAG: formyltetrahydrofolate deformylase [Actinomycetales bacterium]|nr:formyltetrahydrofolate deformylase [Actinomycetales bacterium]
MIRSGDRGLPSFQRSDPQRTSLTRGRGQHPEGSTPASLRDVATHVLTLSCPDRPGIVHAVAGTVVDQGGNIVESQQFGDPATDRFFMRVAVEPASAPTGPRAGGTAPKPPTWSKRDTTAFGAGLRMGFEPVARQFAMSWQLHHAQTPTRTLVLVSLGGHCLNDLLFRARSGAVPIDVPGVVSNHPDLAGMAEFYGVPFHHVPVTEESGGKPAAEARLLALVEELDIELVVLARYMQVLSDDLCRTLEGRIINIHHSFLPSFKGARPYHQAHARGVKLIGATAHYVTAALDEGPIIEQDVARVDHGMSPGDLAATGRDVECQVLARAVRWHAEHRVLLNGTSTVVFR